MGMLNNPTCSEWETYPKHFFIWFVLRNLVYLYMLNISTYDYGKNELGQSESILWLQSDTRRTSPTVKVTERKGKFKTKA